MKQNNTSPPRALVPLAQSVDDGAPPSNTAPTNDILPNSDISIYRNSIDSLYLSFKGELSENWEKKLSSAKVSAQSDLHADRTQAQLTICNQLFEVRSRGRGKYKYVLVDAWYQIQVAGSDSTSIPMAYVQISSELLTLLGVEESINKLLPIINSFGKHEGPKVSRIDLCVDFTCPIQMDSWSHNAWITRAHHIDPHYVNGVFSGWSIGQGGVIVCRLYNKLLELKKSKKHYMLPLWRDLGWNGEVDVWRLEFQIRGAFLKNPTTKTLSNVLDSLDSLWSYCATQWCRLSIENDSDSVKTRWPIHPMWQSLSQVDWGTTNFKPLHQPKKHRAPSDDFLFVNGLGAITSFMAREGIEDYEEGLGEYFAAAINYHDGIKGSSFNKYIRRKLKEKQRRFNTKNNNPNNGVTDLDRLNEAEAYRKAKDGD